MGQTKIFVCAALAERDETITEQLRFAGTTCGIDVRIPGRGKKWGKGLEDANAVLAIATGEGVRRLGGIPREVQVAGGRHFARPVVLLLERGTRLDADLAPNVRVVAFHKGIGVGKVPPLDLKKIDEVLKRLKVRRRDRRAIMALAQIAQGMLGLGEVVRRASA